MLHNIEAPACVCLCCSPIVKNHHLLHSVFSSSLALGSTVVPTSTCTVVARSTPPILILLHTSHVTYLRRAVWTRHATADNYAQCSIFGFLAAPWSSSTDCFASLFFSATLANLRTCRAFSFLMPKSSSSLSEVQSAMSKKPSMFAHPSSVHHVSTFSASPGVLSLHVVRRKCKSSDSLICRF